MLRQAFVCRLIVLYLPPVDPDGTASKAMVRAHDWKSRSQLESCVPVQSGKEVAADTLAVVNGAVPPAQQLQQAPTPVPAQPLPPPRPVPLPLPQPRPVAVQLTPQQQAQAQVSRCCICARLGVQRHLPSCCCDGAVHQGAEPPSGDLLPLGPHKMRSHDSHGRLPS
jgi:hypothetical protein